MPKDFKGKEPIGWFTANGVHIPMYDGETPDDALNRVKESVGEKLTVRSFKKFRAVEGVHEQTHEFFYNTDNSNALIWKSELSDSEISALAQYTGSSAFAQINDVLYGSVTEKDIDLSPDRLNQLIYDMDNVTGNFNLYKGIIATRQADGRMLGFNQGEKLTKQKILDKLQESFGYIQYPAFMSAGADDEGMAYNTLGDVMVHIQVPPSKGAGAYIADPKTSRYVRENEFVFARNSVLKYDLNSLKYNNSIWEINARWVGNVKE